MSIATDIRSYADTAVVEGKKVLESTISTAQAQLNGVTGQANDLVGKYRDNLSAVTGKASEAVSDMRASAEKVINIEAIKAAVEPYLAQAKDYQANVQGRAEGIYASLRKDDRVGKVVDTAGTMTGVVVETVVGTARERVVKPVQSLTGLRGKPAKPAAAKTAPAKTPAKTAPASSAARTAPAKTAKPATTRPAAAKPAASKTTSRPASGRTTTAKRTPKA